MTAKALPGRPAAEAALAEVRARLARRAARGFPPPELAIVWVGDDAASASYIRAKERAARALGVASRLVRLPATAGEAEIAGLVRRLSEDPSVDGVLVQAPLPAGVDLERVVAALDPGKDVDGFHPENAGRLFRGRPAVVPCTPRGIMELLRHYGIAVRGRRAVVLGRSNLVGRPLAALLEQADATVTLCHSKTEGLAEVAREGEILVAAVGRPGFVTSGMVRPGAVVVDVGVSRVGGRLAGDVAAEVAEVAGALTPVPGGVGPMTVAMLMRNVVELAEARRGATA
ncbi:MAG: bifunctional 5,10-methylenetetrahydrofolate dehydrogenase/5,10-methenyltetrahydrofolate cyclohydrolase [Clostridia bacterium]|nr:bifunctional 5,10-methylenetetrahydrofolate dehydrogenase/5,10-methenyltetrahydrofolate cyclohydrolase [Clostridia bacterium]